MGIWRKLLRGAGGFPGPPPFVDEAPEPANDLERALAPAEGAHDAPALLALLAAARLFVPTRQDVASMAEGDAFRPVLLDYDEGPCVAVLTDASRLRGLLPAVPDVQGGIDVEGAWILARCPPGVGLALNPGWRDGVVVPAAALADVRRD